MKSTVMIKNSKTTNGLVGDFTVWTDLDTKTTLPNFPDPLLCW